jgi:hypothetical protein
MWRELMGGGRSKMPAAATRSGFTARLDRKPSHPIPVRHRHNTWLAGRNAVALSSSAGEGEEAAQRSRGANPKVEARTALGIGFRSSDFRTRPSAFKALPCRWRCWPRWGAGHAGQSTERGESDPQMTQVFADGKTGDLNPPSAAKSGSKAVPNLTLDYASEYKVRYV